MNEYKFTFKNGITKTIKADKCYLPHENGLYYEDNYLLLKQAGFKERKKGFFKKANDNQNDLE